MKRVESESGRECEEKEIGDSYCTDGPTGPEGGESSPVRNRPRQDRATDRFPTLTRPRWQPRRVGPSW
ncbi:hypothetical protein ACOMHN_050079 [Nucella lapillus]